MRDIKFRAWDEINKIMHYAFEFIRSGVQGNDWIVFKSDKQKLDGKNAIFHPLENPYFSQQLKIMQFTEVKDKNGKEIYEGDIVNAKDEMNGAEILGCVNYYPNLGWFAVSIDGNYDEHLNFYDLIQTEVIGNIYENPELLTPAASGE